MNTVVKESPAQYFGDKVRDADQAEGFSASFFHFKVYLPNLPFSAEEMSAKELLVAAEATGSFRFLDDEGEDIYRP